MISLTINFNSLDEVAKFIDSKSVPTNAKIEVPAGANIDVPSTPAAVEPKSEEKRRYTKEDLVNMSDADAEALLTPSQKGKRTKALKELEPAAPAPVQETAAAVMQPHAQVPPVIEQTVSRIDRDAYISKASALVNEIKALGVPETEVMPKLVQAYQAAGVAQFCRVSELGDTDLPNVVAQIENLVMALKGGVAQSGSFI